MVWRRYPHGSRLSVGGGASGLIAQETEVISHPAWREKPSCWVLGLAIEAIVTRGLFVYQAALLGPFATPFRAVDLHRDFVVFFD